jgi:probable rRNA maturation factor
MSTAIRVELQVVGSADGLPAEKEIRDWLQRACLAVSPDAGRGCELVVRVVDEAESRDLNRRYRGKDRATNVLAFPAAEPGEMPGPAGAGQRALGDLVLCGTVIAREAAEQRKDVTAHWAHMLVHGALHLLGFDHETEGEASRMESLEIRILGGRALPDPYAPR